MSDLTEKRCSTCGVYKPRDSFSKNKGNRANDNLSYKCKDCCSDYFKKLKGGDGYNLWLAQQRATRGLRKSTDPIKVWAQSAAASCKARSKKMGKPCEIDVPWLIANAPTICPLLEIPLVYDSIKLSDNSASVDRRDSTKGYTQDNCSIISFKANRMKSDATRQEIELLTNNLRTYYD